MNSINTAPHNDIYIYLSGIVRILGLWAKTHYIGSTHYFERTISGVWLYIKYILLQSSYYYLCPIKSSWNLPVICFSGKGGMAITDPNFPRSWEKTQSKCLYLLWTWILLKLGVTGYRMKSFAPRNLVPFLGSPILQEYGSWVCSHMKNSCKQKNLDSAYD